MKRLHKALLMPWAGGDSSMAYTNKVIALGPIAYWPMAESSGSVALDATGNARNGAYTGVTLGNAGIGDGRTAASFNGSTSFNNIYSVSLAGAFNGQECTMAAWFQVSGAGVWTDATARRIFRLRSDGSNYIELYKSNTNNLLEVDYIAGGTVKAVTSTALGGSVAWIHIAVTITKAGDALKFYLNGIQSGATQTGLGTYVNALAATLCCIGAASTAPITVWSGLLAHAALWSTPLSAAQVLSLASVP